jgi:hypothetical protein
MYVLKPAKNTLLRSGPDPGSGFGSDRNNSVSDKNADLAGSRSATLPSRIRQSTISHILIK